MPQNISDTRQVNCLTEIFVERALARAAELDAHLTQTGKVVGPLHGLPISLKDQLRMKGIETTMGMSMVNVFDSLVALIYARCQVMYHG